MLNTTKLRFAILALACTGLLSACLPEDKDVQKEAEGSNAVSKETGGYYGTALGNIALRIQDIVTDKGISTVGFQTKKVSDAGIDVDTKGIPADVKFKMCETDDPNDSKYVQLVWIDGRTDAGTNAKFTMQGIGTDVSSMMTALRGRVAPDQLATYQGANQIVKTSAAVGAANGGKTDLPVDCRNAGIPVGAPVLIFGIDNTTPPTVETTTIEYQTVDCDPGQTGSKTQRREVTYKTTKEIERGNWKPSSEQCVTKTEISKGDVLEGTKKFNLGNYAGGDVATLIQGQMAKLACRNQVVTVNGKPKTITTCGDSGNPTTESRYKEKTGTGSDTKEVACIGSPTSGGWTSVSGAGLGIKDDLKSKMGGWSGSVTLIRNTEKAGKDASVSVGEWKGNAINCSADETLTFQCNQVKYKSVVAEEDKWKEKDTGHSVPNYGTSCSAGSTWNAGAAVVAGGATAIFLFAAGATLVPLVGWVAALFGLIAGFMLSTTTNPDCFTAKTMSVTYLNDDYFNGMELTTDGTVTMAQKSVVNTWGNKDKYEPGAVTKQSLKMVDGSVCRWTGRSLGDCPSSVDSAGTWDITNEAAYYAPNGMPRTYDSTPAVILREYDAKNDAGRGTDDVSEHISDKVIPALKKEYDDYKGTGKTVKGVTIKYKRYKNGQAPNTYSTLTYGFEDGDAYLKADFDGTPGEGRVTLNEDAISKRKAMCKKGVPNAYSSLCSDTNTALNQSEQDKTRKLCDMPERVTIIKTGNPIFGFNEGKRTPDVAGDDASGKTLEYCEYILDEMTFDSQNTREYQYHFRDMKAPDTWTQTTLLNKNGATTKYTLQFTGGALKLVPGTQSLACARHETEEVEIPVTVTYRSHFDCFAAGHVQPTLRGGTRTATENIHGCTNFFYSFDTTAVLKKMVVREYRTGNGGWSRPKTIYASPLIGQYNRAIQDGQGPGELLDLYYGKQYYTPGNLPNKINLDLRKLCEDSATWTNGDKYNKSMDACLDTINRAFTSRRN